MSRLRPALLLLGFVAFTVPLMPVQQVLKWLWPTAARGFPHWYHRNLAKLLGVKISVVGALPKSGGALLVANHVSWLDIVVLSAVAPVQFVAKREVGGWPLFGSLARLQGSVFIDRTTRQSTGHERDVIARHLQGGATLVLFPEGTSGDGRSVRPFRSSYFAVDDDVAVVPVVLAYQRNYGLPLTRRLRPRFAWYGDMDLAPHLWGALATGPIDVKVIIGAPLHVGAVGNRKQVARMAETQIREALALALHGRDELG